MPRRVTYGVLAFLPLAILAVLAEAGAVTLLVLNWQSDFRELYALAVFVLVSPLWWVVRAMRSTPDEPTGEVLDPTSHPPLWDEVRAVSAAVGQRPPDRIVVHLGANVTMREVGRYRDLCIGAPLLAAQSVGELRATMAHGIAHQASPVDDRLAQAVEWIRIHASVGGWLRRPLDWYGDLYEAFSLSRIESLEAAADEVSSRVVGREQARSALTRLDEIDRAWRTVLGAYVGLFASSDRRAPLSAALAGVLDADMPPDTEKEGQEELDPNFAAILSSPHRPIHARTAALASDSTATSRPDTDATPAYGLLDQGLDALTEFEGSQFTQDWELTTWEEVAERAGSHNAHGMAHQLGSLLERQGVADTSLGGVVRLLEQQSDSQRLGDLWGCDDDEETALALSSVIAAALVDAGSARFVPDWSEVVGITDAGGGRLDVVEVARRALTDGTFLRDWLTRRNVNLDGPVGRLDRDNPDWLAAVSHVIGPWKGRRDVHVWSTGLLAVPIDPKVVKNDKSAGTTGHQRERLEELAAEGFEAARAVPDALWLDRADIVGGLLGRRLLRVTVRVDLATGVHHDLRTTIESEFVDDPESVGLHLGFLLSLPVEPVATTDA